MPRNGRIWLFSQILGCRRPKTGYNLLDAALLFLLQRGVRLQRILIQTEILLCRAIHSPRNPGNFIEGVVMQRRNSLALLLGLFLVSLQILGCGGGGGSSTTLVISGSLPGTGTVAVAYTGSLTVSGGNGTYTWTATGLPTGLNGSSANTATLTISGTPTRAGTY